LYQTQILAEFKPTMSNENYLAFERGLFCTERYKPEASTQPSAPNMTQ
jgi:hypothetical protein